MTSTSYQLFGADPDNPFRLFFPNYAIDFLTGKAYLNDAYVRGVVNASSGSFTGDVHASSGEFNGTVNASSGIFNGILKASLYYSGVKTITVNSYTIDPATEPFNWFLVSENTSAVYIYLPKASDFAGMEINVINKHSSWNSNRMVRVGITSGDSLCFKQNVYYDGNGHVLENFSPSYTTLNGPATLYCPPNQINRFKSIAGKWYAIEGIFTGE